MRKKWLGLKRAQALALAATILIPMCLGNSVWQAEGSSDGLCVHHTEHTDQCGYVEPVQGHECTHVYDTSHSIGNHVHDENCGYVQATAGSPCRYAVEGCPYCVVSWEWADPQGTLTESEDSWYLQWPGNDLLTRETLAELLPAQILATTDNGGKVELNLTWDLTQIPEDGAVDGDDTLTAELTATKENYALTEDAAPLKVTVKPGNEEKNAKGMAMPSGTPPYSCLLYTSRTGRAAVLNRLRLRKCFRYRKGFPPQSFS